MHLEMSSWPRLVEVHEYAERRGISLNEAIEELVNSGLSHDSDMLARARQRHPAGRKRPASSPQNEADR